MINWLQNLSIRRKLMLIIMTTSAVVLMVASAAFVFADRLANQKKLVYLVTSQADLVGANTTAALAFRDNIAANETLSSLREQDHILEAVLYDRDGEEFAKYSNDTADNVRKLKSVIADVRFDGNLLHLTQPVFLENEQIGSIALVADVNRLHARMGDITGLVFLVLIGALIAALLISMRIHRSISVPVTELANVAQRISDDQDYSIRARKLTDDELGNLVDGVNNMLTQIQKRDQMLARHTETLEKKVQERTSELRQLTEQFKHRAYHDELTGLPNRALFEDRLSHALDVAKRHQQRLAVMFLDLDRFKIINDTLGHAAGDKLLCHVASTLTHCLRAEDTVARLGGDEFTVLLQNVENTELAGKTARKIIKTIQQPVEIDGHELHISTSIGIAMYPDDEKDTVGLMRCADAAMYLSKEGGRNRYHFYTDSMHQNAMKRMRLEAELHRAISGNNLTLVYFPRRDLISNQVTGVEAL
ncbi:MAG: putative bifunctional diguanylate cyclase/phosphodiesterase, partial [bacterium]